MTDDKNQQTSQGGFNPYVGGMMGDDDFSHDKQQEQEEDKTPANYQIGKDLPKKIDVEIPKHDLNFDEQHFLHLLAGSISLAKEEKKRIINTIPKLMQEQIDELIKIFEEERKKFSELSEKHVEHLKKLEKQHLADWQDIEMEQKAGEKKEEDDKKAEEIRKQLGL